MHDVRRLLRAKARQARGLLKESDGKALEKPDLEEEGRKDRMAGRDLERGNRDARRYDA
ncbi:hypothetical protein ACH4MM_07195 [Streptomyces pratensis]|uniref:hypothetical protein n=1 Tax=Streptomyces pratensis TaxID=1169025 RepID=UPI00378AAFD2